MNVLAVTQEHVQGFKEELRQWDVSFWAERLREAKFNITDEELRPYFALPNVLKGLFQVSLLCLFPCRILYGVLICPLSRVCSCCIGMRGD